MKNSNLSHSVEEPKEITNTSSEQVSLFLFNSTDFYQNTFSAPQTHKGYKDTSQTTDLVGM